MHSVAPALTLRSPWQRFTSGEYVLVDTSTDTWTAEPGRQMSTRGAFATSPVHDVLFRQTPSLICAHETGPAMMDPGLRWLLGKDTDACRSALGTAEAAQEEVAADKRRVVRFYVRRA